MRDPDQEPMVALMGEHPLPRPSAAVEFAGMHASLSRRLFGHNEALRIDRFKVLETVGRGAMGIVFAAYDPRLDRKVALKVLRDARGRPDVRARVLREARALARVSHPNVITIFEAGELPSGDAFIAMEYLAGGTLRDWMGKHAGAPSAWKATVAMFVQIGRGLAAAHASGLVHRDFKPDNVLLGSDGRPRVADFGLAVETPRLVGAAEQGTPDDVGPETRRGGTPAYMAPEQRFERAEPRSDQFSFCVALWEALFAERPNVGQGSMLEPPEGGVPRRIVDALRKGLSPNPANRFDGLDLLLRKISPHPGRARNWIVVALVAIGTAAGVASGSAWQTDRSDDPCAPLHRALTATSSTEDATGRFARVAKAYENALRDTIDQACATTDELPPEASVLSCLDQQISGLQILHADVSSGEVTPLQAARALAQLPEPTSCTDAKRLAHEPALPSDPQLREHVLRLRKGVADARVHAVLGQDAEASQALQDILIESRTLQYRPVEADALRELAKIEARSGQAADAEGTQLAAIVAAEASGHDRTKAHVLLERAATLAQHLGRVDEAAEQIELARATAARVGTPPELMNKMRVTRGIVALVRGKPEVAIESLRPAVSDIEQRSGRDAFDLVEALNVLAAALARNGEAKEAFETFERTRGLIELHYGKDHPLYARILSNAGSAARDASDLETAQRYLEEALALTVDNVGEDHPTTAIVMHNLADILTESGEVDAALEVATRALSIAERVHGTESAQLRWALATVANAQARKGSTAEARATLDRAERLVVQQWGEHALQLLPLMEARLEIEASQGDRQAVSVTRRRARAIADEHGVEPGPAFERPSDP